MATRADIIAQAKKRLGILGAGLSSTDDSTGDFHYPLNYALTQMRITNSDLPSFSDNQVRIAVFGTEYHTLAVLAKKYYGRCTEEGKKEFERILQLMRAANKAWRAALSGSDVPDPIDSVAEEIVAWGSTYGNRSVTAFDQGGSVKDAPFHINEFGTDESEYLTDPASEDD